MTNAEKINVKYKNIILIIVLYLCVFQLSELEAHKISQSSDFDVSEYDLIARI